MHFGTFHIMGKPEGLTDHQVISETLREIRHAERLNFHTAWLTEHHASSFGICTSPSVMAAAAAVQTQKIRIGYGVNVTPLHHPVRLAEEIAMVDQLSKGRVVAGFGPGYSPYEFDAYGLDIDERHTRHAETLSIVQKAWTNKTFDHQGKIYHLHHVTTLPRPKQTPHPPIAVAANSLDSVAEVARAGNRLLLLVKTATLPDLMQHYQKIATASGLCDDFIQQTLSHTGVLRNVCLANTHDLAYQTAYKATTWLMKLRNKLAQETPSPALLEEQVKTYLSERAIIGTPEEVIEQINTLQQTGIGEVICWFRWGTMSHQQILTAMTLFAKRVMPVFQPSN